MFSQCQHITFSTAVYHAGNFATMTDMDRLLAAAVQNLNIQPDSWADLARVLNQSDQVINNWRSRGIPAYKLMDVAQLVKTDPYWIRDGGGDPPVIVRDPSLKEILRCAEPLSEYAKQAAIKEISAIAELVEHATKAARYK